MPSRERRQEKRILLPQPIVGKFGTAVVVVIDLSPSGARIEHYARLDRGAKRSLRLQWGGDTVGVTAEVMRSRIHRFIPGDTGVTVYRSGVRFDESQQEYIARIRETISKTVAATLVEQVANARGFWTDAKEDMPIFREGMITTEDPDLEKKLAKYLTDSRVVRQTGFYRFTLTGRTWSRKWSLDPAQPPHGFTLSARESEANIRTLMETYEAATADNRELIRRLAEASLERELSQNGSGSLANQTH